MASQSIRRRVLAIREKDISWPGVILFPAETITLDVRSGSVFKRRGRIEVTWDLGSV